MDMSRILAALCIAIGLIAGGWFIGHGFALGRHTRIVTVKGLAERDVKADLALWPIRYVEAGNKLKQVQAAIQRDDNTVATFLDRHGLGAQAVAFRQLQVTDRAAQAWGNNNYRNRYVITRTVMVRTPKVDTVAQVAQDTGELVDAGVVLDDQNGNSAPSYLFRGLNTLKPAMIAEATRNARTAGEQFAHDSGSRLGGIVRANQGVFQILPRDKAPMLQQQRQVNKTVRVVSTLSYALED
jgi:hypothetical protein